MGNEKMHLIAGLVVEIDESGELGTVLKIERHVSAIVKGVLQGVPAGGGIAAFHGAALDGTRLVRGQGVFVGLGHGRNEKGYAP